MSRLDNLTAEQQNTLQEFQTISQIDDLNKSIATLEAYNWNLERALTAIFDAANPSEKDAASSSFSTHTQPTSGGSEFPSNDRASSSSMPPPRPPVVNRPLSPRRLGIFAFIAWPVTFTFNMLWTLITYGFRLLTRQSLTASSPQPPRTERDPATLAQRFLIEFEESYGRTHPNFHQGGYSSALSLAKREGRFLLAILLSSEHDSTNEFCNTTLQSPELLSYFDERQVLVWGGNVRESEAFQVSTTLQATTYPFLALITLTNPPRGSGSSGSKMSVVDRIEGLSTPDEIQRRIQSAIDRYGEIIAAVRREREELDSARRLRQEQDRAYQVSLRQDQEKARQARIAKEAVENSLREQRAEEERQLKYAQDREAYRRWLASQIPAEPSADQKEVTRLRFRMNEGEHIVGRFGPDTTIENLYAFIDSYPYHNASSSTSVPPSEEYVHVYDFQIASPMPKIVFKPSNMLIKDEKRLWPSANLVVEEIDE